MPAKQHVSLSWYLKAWSSRKWVSFLVYSIIPTSIVDAIYTWVNIAEHGLFSELNPLMRWMFKADLTVLWFLVGASISFVCLALLGSLYVSAGDRGRAHIATAFSAILTLRNVAAAYNVVYYYSLLKYPQAMLLTAIPSFLSIRYFLLHENSFTWVNFRRLLWVLRDKVEMTLLLLDWGSVGKFFKRIAGRSPQIDIRPVSFPLARRKKRVRLLILVSLLVLMPFLLLGLLQFMLDYFLTKSIPSWYRGLGIVSEIQGAIFIVGFFSIIVAIGVILYLIMSIWESVSSP